MPIDSLNTKHISHFALLCLWNIIIHVKVRPIWPYSSQPHQNKKWIIIFHRHCRAKCQICFVIREPMCISGEMQGQKVFLDAVYFLVLCIFISMYEHLVFRQISTIFEDFLAFVNGFWDTLQSID